LLRVVNQYYRKPSIKRATALPILYINKSFSRIRQRGEDFHTYSVEHAGRAKNVGIDLIRSVSIESLVSELVRKIMLAVRTATQKATTMLFLGFSVGRYRSRPGGENTPVNCTSLKNLAATSFKDNSSVCLCGKTDDPEVS